mgnify:CR=1 FL=1
MTRFWNGKAGASTQSSKPGSQAASSAAIAEIDDAVVSGRRVSLDGFVLSVRGPLLQLARERAAQGDAALEHRAMVVVLAFYVNGKGLAALVPSARSWPVPARRVVTLAGRTDFPQHFTISAALTATAGSRVAPDLATQEVLL